MWNVNTTGWRLDALVRPWEDRLRLGFRQYRLTDARVRPRPRGGADEAGCLKTLGVATSRQTTRTTDSPLGGNEMAEIQWLSNVDEMLDNAKAQGKAALLDFTAAPR